MKRNEKNMAFDFVHPSKLGIVHVHSEAKKVVSSLIQKKLDSHFQTEVG